MLKHINFMDGKKDLAILIPQKDLNYNLLLEHYILPLEKMNISRSQILAISLDQNEQGKSPVGTVIKPCLKQVEKMLNHLKIHNVLVCDAAYFKTLCKVSKAEGHYGYPMPTIWPGTMGFISTNYTSLFRNPDAAKKIAFSLKAVANHMQKKKGLFEDKILLDCEYPTTDKEIINAIARHKDIENLTCDIETYSLKVNKAKLATLSFARDMHSGIAFNVGANRTVRHHLKQFFSTYQGKLIFHNATFDTKILIWELFMEHPQDMDGMLEGLHHLYRDLEDTKILAYLSLNSTTTISLKLKELAFEYTGNYALDEDIKNVINIPPAKLLTYNMTDAVATWYLYNLYKPVVEQTQKAVYEEIFLPALKVITQMELCGMPINLGQVLSTEHKLDDIAIFHKNAIMQNPVIVDYTDVLREKEAEKANLKLKKLRKTKDDFLHFEFNPASPNQTGGLFYEYLGLPILGKTDKGAPSTDSKNLKALSHWVDKNHQGKHKDLIEHFIELADVRKILDTFIPAFKENSITKQGWEYLHGNFNLGGTKSGRLSSSDPNLTNIPSTGTKYAVAIKQCFQAPPHCELPQEPGCIVVGADFFSLEDRISALQTKDPNKLKIYSDGLDGHCLRAYYYFGHMMEGIDPDSVDSINSIGTKYPELRQLSKSPTFLLTYMGTYKGLMKQFGFTEEEAKRIETNYHDLYSVSDLWVQDRITEAGKTGYVELAFGLRLRTPILPQVVLTSQTLPWEAHQEIKTAGNALGQSYGLLNTRAANEFMQRVWKSEYAKVILPICQIHDSQYYMIQNTLGCLKWVNDHLIACMEWNELEAIQHPEISLRAALEIYYPSWANPITIPNRVTLRELQKILKPINDENKSTAGTLPTTD